MASAEKVALLTEYTELLKDAKSIYLADYKGLDVEGMQDLRKQFRANDITFTVVKNCVLKRAATEVGIEGLSEHLVGPLAVAVSRTDEVQPAKIMVKYAKDNSTELPTLKAAVVGGKVYDAVGAVELSQLPSLDEMRAMMLNLFSTPATHIVRVLAAPGTQVARVIKARADQLESQG